MKKKHFSIQKSEYLEWQLRNIFVATKIIVLLFKGNQICLKLFSPAHSWFQGESPVSDPAVGAEVVTERCFFFLIFDICQNQPKILNYVLLCKV